MPRFKLFKAGFTRGQFVTKSRYVSNKQMQEELTPKVLDLLPQLNIPADRPIIFEFFFYALKVENAKALAKDLENLGYEAVYNTSEGDKKLYLITGSTTPMVADAETTTKWASDMVDLGFKHDCDFDGWGTGGEQV